MRSLVATLQGVYVVISFLESGVIDGITVSKLSSSDSIIYWAAVVTGIRNVDDAN